MRSLIALIIAVPGVVYSAIAVPTNTTSMSKRASGFFPSCPDPSIASDFTLTATCSVHGDGGGSPSTLDLNKCLAIDANGGITCQPG